MVLRVGDAVDEEALMQVMQVRRVRPVFRYLLRNRLSDNHTNQFWRRERKNVPGCGR